MRVRRMIEGWSGSLVASIAILACLPVSSMAAEPDASAENSLPSSSYRSSDDRDLGESPYWQRDMARRRGQPAPAYHTLPPLSDLTGTPKLPFAAAPRYATPPAVSSAAPLVPDRVLSENRLPIAQPVPHDPSPQPHARARATPPANVSTDAIVYVPAGTPLAPASAPVAVTVQRPSPIPSAPVVEMPSAPVTAIVQQPSAIPSAPIAEISPAPVTAIVQQPSPIPSAPAAPSSANALVESPPISDESRRILAALPPEPPAPHHKPKRPVALKHLHPSALDQDEVKKHEGVGIHMSVRRPKADLAHMEEQAYDALMAGNQEEAVALYKDVLSIDPDNKLALFGLATTYHRAGQIQLARPLYGRLLALDPGNVEGLNNFLVLLADEAPQDALAELAKLEQSHPSFSPVAAQRALIYQKLGQYPQAVAEMNRAMALAPENLKYRYDLAVILDTEGAWPDAAVLYQDILVAGERGAKLPARPEDIQERLTFIRSNTPKTL